MKLIAAILAIILTSCVTATPPIGQETKREFTQEVTGDYIDVYRKIASKANDCYAGEYSKVLAELDKAEKQGRIEVTNKNWMNNAQAHEDDFAYRLIVVQAVNDKTTRVTVSGTEPRFVYGTHLVIPKWLSGYLKCSPN